MTARRLLFFASLLFGCGSPHEVHCDDLAPLERSRWPDVEALAVTSNPKACSRCHTTQSPVANLNFEGPGVAYDALTAHFPRIYEEIAAREMPQGGPFWTEDDLRVLRGWYCRGGFYAR